MCRQINQKKNDRAVSETIGAVMLISVVVVAVAIIGVVLTSQGTPQKIPALDAIISNVDRTVFVYHDGGDTLYRQDIYIMVNGERRDFAKSGDTGWTTLSTGETLAYTVPGIDPITSVRVVYDNSQTAATLSSANFGPSGMATTVPTPTSGPTHTITASAGPGGSISPSGTVVVNEGASRTFTMNPGAGNTVSDVLVDGVSVGPVASYTFTNVQDDHAIVVTFALITPPSFGSIAPSAGPIAGSTSVTITGTGFSGATAVTFGGTAATGITVVSDTTITATTPAHTAGIVDVTITAPGGSATGTGTFTYLPLPTYGSINPVSGPTSGSTSVTIIGTGFSGATAVTFGGTAATGITVVSDTTITATTPAHTAGIVDVTVTTPGGSATGTGVYTYIGPPTFTGITPSPGPYDGGDDITITGTGFTGVTSVLIGGNPADDVSVSGDGTIIEATTPPYTDGGAVDVVIVTSHGSVTGTNAYRYYRIRTFLSGTTTWSVPANVATIEYLVVAGGGGGGRYGGGGGAGGFRSGTLTGLSGSQTITVGAGGSGGTSTTIRGSDGFNSVFSTVTATGGGGGGGNSGTLSIRTGRPGGSGGGGIRTDGLGGTGTAGQGNDGGRGVTYQTTRYNGGGGGGASAAGTTATQFVGGVGGAGSYSDISGTNIQYACGGGGGGRGAAGSAGCSSAGDGQTGNNVGRSATANFGGGGGGGGSGPRDGGAGGSGIVIIKYY